MKAVKLLLISLFFAYSSAAMALPSLQLGPDASNPGDWSYDSVNETWVVNDGPFNLNVYALDSAWDSSITSGFAYLIAAAVPSTADDTDAFDISVTDGSKVAYGFGAPPIEDTNTPAPHNVYDTYYEVYEFEFDRSVSGWIGNTQTGTTDEALGYSYSFDIDVISLAAGVEGVHFDLFTVTPAQWVPNSGVDDKKLVYAIAPFSHDAEYCEINCAHDVPEPTMVGLLAMGLLALAVARRNIYV